MKIKNSEYEQDQRSDKTGQRMDENGKKTEAMGVGVESSSVFTQGDLDYHEAMSDIQ